MASKVVGTGVRPPNAGKGRKKGVPNKTTTLLKDAILAAAARAGGEGGLEAYLEKQANTNSGPFMGLLGKVLPMQLTGEGGGPVKFQRIERVIVDPKD
jgi:hypothetical protein